jgi:hypothetical protein
LPGGRRREGDAHHVELLFQAPDAEAEHEAPAGGAIDVGRLPRQEVGRAVVDAVDHGAEPDTLCGDSQRGQGGPAVGVGGWVVVAPVGVDAHRLHPLHQSNETLPIRRLGKDADAEADPVLPLRNPRMRTLWHRGQGDIDARRLGHQGSLR